MREVPGPEGTRFASIALVRETGSTNRDLLAAAAEGAPEGRVLITDHQTAGRGRQGRAWLDEPGSALLCSVLLRPPASWAGFVPLATGLAVVDAVAEWGVDLGLKWPNDVLVPGEASGEPARPAERKICGILSEAASTGGGPEQSIVVVTGFGFNLAWSSEGDLGDEVSARGIDLAGVLRQAGRLQELPDRLVLARRILVGLEKELRRLEAGGPAALLEVYRPVCRTLGRHVRLETPSQVIEGIAVDIADDGGLVVEDGQQRVTLHAGDAHHV